MRYPALAFVVRTVVVSLAAVGLVNGQTMTLSTSSSDYAELTNVFSDVDFFTIEIEIDAPLAPGVYVDPDIVRVIYQVTGDLVPGTPSNFPAFDLQRDISGAEFYAQGSSLSFEIAPSAVLDDGIQAAELAGNAVILTFNAREVDNGRFHPAILTLNADGTGRIQNSDNVPTQNPLVQVNFGEEYITDLRFDPGNITLIKETPPPAVGSGNAVSFPGLGALILLGLWRRWRKRGENGVELNQFASEFAD
jgi:hypothetical protein